MVNTDDYISWIQNELTFDNDKLADIIINLNKWYGVDIEMSVSSLLKKYLCRSLSGMERIWMKF